MTTDKAEPLLAQHLTEKIIGVFYSVYNELGPAFLRVFTRTLFRSRYDKPGSNGSGVPWPCRR